MQKKLQKKIEVKTVDISIVIVSYNCKSYLQKCLESVEQAQKKSGLVVETIVVDNNSQDGTKKLKQYKKYAWVKWIDADNNGFGAGNNIGLKRSKGKYIFLLNPDTELSGNCLWKMFEYMQMHVDVGVLGPKLVYGDGSLQISAYDNFPCLLSAFWENTLLDRVGYWLFSNWIYPGKLFSRELHSNYDREVAHLIGAAMLVRHEVYDMVDGFDEQFFMYREETDWQYRMKMVGWKIVYFPKVKVVHFEGKSTGETRFKKENWLKKLDMYLPSVYKYQRKWGGTGSQWVLWLIYILGSVWTIFILLWIWILNNVFGWVMNNMRKKINKSIVDIATYHWMILYWHWLRVL